MWTSEAYTYASAKRATSGILFIQKRALFFCFHKGFKAGIDTISEFLITMMFCKISEILKVVVAGLKLSLCKIIVLKEEVQRIKELVRKSLRKFKGLLWGTGIIVGLDHIHYHILIDKAKIGDIQREVDLRNALLTHIEHLHRPLLIIDLKHLLSHIDKEESLRKHAAESVEILIINKIVSTFESIPSVNILYLVIEILRISKADLSTLHLALYWHELV